MEHRFLGFDQLVTKMTKEELFVKRVLITHYNCYSHFLIIRKIFLISNISAGTPLETVKIKAQTK